MYDLKKPQETQHETKKPKPIGLLSLGLACGLDGRPMILAPHNIMEEIIFSHAAKET